MGARDGVSKRDDSELMGTELIDDELAPVMGGAGPSGPQPRPGFGRRNSPGNASALPGARPATVGTLAEEPAPITNRGFTGAIPDDLELVPASAPGGYALAPKGTYTEPEIEPGSYSPAALQAFLAAEDAKRDAAEAHILAEMAAAEERRRR